jgi:hypothetical protein
VPPNRPEPRYANVGLFLSVVAASTLVGAYPTGIRYLALLFVVLPMAALGLIMSSILALPPSAFGPRSRVSVIVSGGTLTVGLIVLIRGLRTLS